MSHPSGPPPYDAIYLQGSPTQPVQIQPQPRVVLQVHHHQTQMTQNFELDAVPSHIICHNCNYRVMTTTKMTPAMRTHCCAICLLVFGLWPCCCIPYCMSSCNNIDHYCPKCNAYIGSYTG